MKCNHIVFECRYVSVFVLNNTSSSKDTGVTSCVVTGLKINLHLLL